MNITFTVPVQPTALLITDAVTCQGRSQYTGCTVSPVSPYSCNFSDGSASHPLKRCV